MWRCLTGWRPAASRVSGSLHTMETCCWCVIAMFPSDGGLRSASHNSLAISLSLSPPLPRNWSHVLAGGGLNGAINQWAAGLGPWFFPPRYLFCRPENDRQQLLRSPRCRSLIFCLPFRARVLQFCTSDDQTMPINGHHVASPQRLGCVDYISAARACGRHPLVPHWRRKHGSWTQHRGRTGTEVGPCVWWGSGARAWRAFGDGDGGPEYSYYYCWLRARGCAVWKNRSWNP